MTYEKAKELKDAGFPQGKTLAIPKDSGILDSDGTLYLPKEPVYIPTLSELIEACGEDFMLTNECGQWEAWSGSVSSMVRMGESGAKYECTGSTPEEAVANLWLALNRK